MFKQFFDTIKDNVVSFCSRVIVSIMPSEQYLEYVRRQDNSLSTVDDEILLQIRHGIRLDFVKKFASLVGSIVGFFLGTKIMRTLTA